MLLSASAYAQTNIAKAMDDLIGNKSYAQYIKSEIYKERDSSGHVSYCYIYGFSLPESKAKVLDNIQGHLIRMRTKPIRLPRDRVA